MKQIPEEDATAPVEPDYDAIRVPPEIEQLCPQVIEDQWLDPSDKYSFDQCQEMIKAMNPEIQNFEQEAFNMIFTENNTKNEDQMASKGDMQTYAMNYLLHFERSRVRSEYEAAVQLHKMKKQQYEDDLQQIPMGTPGGKTSQVDESRQNKSMLSHNQKS